jgi:hypothetical protein
VILSNGLSPLDLMLGVTEDLIVTQGSRGGGVRQQIQIPNAQVGGVDCNLQPRLAVAETPKYAAVGLDYDNQ